MNTDNDRILVATLNIYTLVHIASTDPLSQLFRGDFVLSSSTFMLQISCPPKCAFIGLRLGTWWVDLQGAEVS